MSASTPTLTAWQVGGIVLSIAVGLACDLQFDIVGQCAMSMAHWWLMFHLLARRPPIERRALVACLALATVGELFLSLVWGVYTYRLGNVPFFIPPGHVLLLILGIELARRMPDAVAHGIVSGAALYALVATTTGLDTLSCALFALLAAAWLALPGQRRLYASTFALALALEIYGTALGNWRWAGTVPATALVTTNPPVLAGAFYCALDALVAAIAPLLVGGMSVRRPRPA